MNIDAAPTTRARIERTNMKNGNRNALAFAALLALATAAAAHARLKSSAPADGAAVSAPPAALRLQYDEPVEVALSTVKLIGPGDAAVATAQVAADPKDDKALVLALPPLAPGAYRAQWTTVGHDGHRTKGEIRFTVK
jgi:methionine-rich copper-binding protein CopC